MAGKAQVTSSVPALTASDIEGMIKQMSGGGPSAVSADEAGGEFVNPADTYKPTPRPGAPARPMGPEANEPAIPKGNRPVPTRVTPEQQSVQEPTSQPAELGGPEQTFAEQLSQVQRELEELRAKERTQADQARRDAEEARINSLPAEEQPEARRKAAEMRAVQADLRLAEYEVAAKHPFFVEIMSTLSDNFDIEMDPDGYRTLAAKMEPLLEAMIERKASGSLGAIQQQVQQNWGVRPAPQERMVPTPDDPLIVEYKDSYAEVTRTGGSDPGAMQRFLTAGQRVRSELGIDLSSVVR